MYNYLPLLFTLLFLIAWLIGAIAWFQVSMTGNTLKRLLRKQDRSIRFSFGISSAHELSRSVIIKGSKQLINTFFAFGSTSSVRSYLDVFIDLDAVYATDNKDITERMDKIISKTG